MIDYQTIKKAAKETPGVNVADLIALAAKNDPFYMGSPGQAQKARWFARLWQEYGYKDGVHLRRVHYRLISQATPVLRPDGKPYNNTKKDWAYLVEAGKAARYLKLVRTSAIIDMRNPAPHRMRRYYYEDAPGYKMSDLADFEISLPEWPDLPEFETEGYEESQPHHLEIWIEKTTMNDVLLPLCKKFEVNLVTGAGELSITAVRDYIHRVYQADRPAVIFYLADFDPAGHGMPVSVARKIEYFLQDLGLDLDVTLHPLLLNKDQVARYNLPPKPFEKEQTFLRAANLGAFDGTAVELDALEAIHPGMLARIVKKEILRYYDDELAEQVQEQKDDLETTLYWSRALALIPYANELIALQDKFDQAVADFEDAVGPVDRQLPGLISKIKRDLRAVDVDVDDYPLPEPEPADEIKDPLFSSERDYMDQLKAYKLYKNGS